MLRIRAFQGLVPDPSQVTDIACVPYDVLNTDEARVLAEGKPNTLLRVDRAELELPADTNPYSDAVYARAKANFERLQQNGALRRESTPAIYLCQQRMGAHVQTGLAAVCHVDDYVHERVANPLAHDIIKKHERTRQDKEDDRTKLIGTLRADTGPVFLTYRGTGKIDAIIAHEIAKAPANDFTAPDGIRHTVWKITAPDTIAALVAEFAKLPTAYVADGHHRTASAARVGLELRAKGQSTPDSDWFLCVLFPGSQLQIMPYNRAVKDLHGLTPEQFLAAVGQSFTLTPGASDTPAQPGDIRMYLGGKWYALGWQHAPDADPISRLDVEGLQQRLLAPILGIDDPRTSKRIDFIGGIRGPGELVKLVDAGKAAVAFSMFPTTVQQLMDIADAGQIMPPKSTWFEPKLRSGLFVHTF
ncbi:MAG: DUF1015 family protein [Verrucomicrobia bacterium]|nr:DUF1015 family protein [Verrucomicrobiota bacterium]